MLFVTGLSVIEDRIDCMIGSEAQDSSDVSRAEGFNRADTPVPLGGDGFPSNNFMVTLSTVSNPMAGKYGNLSFSLDGDEWSDSRNLEISVDTSKHQWCFACGSSGILTTNYSRLRRPFMTDWRVLSIQYIFDGVTVIGVKSVQIYVNKHEYLPFS